MSQSLEIRIVRKFYNQESIFSGLRSEKLDIANQFETVCFADVLASVGFK